MQGPENSIGALNMAALLKLSRCKLDLLGESSRKRPNYKVISVLKIIKIILLDFGVISGLWIIAI